VQDVADEAGHSICGEFCNWLVLDPLCKLVDGHHHVSKASWRSCQGPYHVRPQHANDHEGGMVIRL
jgi:hypothetical protein